MPIKLKPSTKEYIRDSKNKITNKWTVKHFPPSSIKTTELKEMLNNSAYSKKRHLIKKELVKRNINI